MKLEALLAILSLSIGVLIAAGAALRAVVGASSVQVLAAIAIMMLALGSTLGYSWWTKRGQGTAEAAEALRL